MQNGTAWPALGCLCCLRAAAAVDPPCRAMWRASALQWDELAMALCTRGTVLFR